jgi:hypothetical protein
MNCRPRARDCVSDIPLGVIAMIAFYVAILRRSAMKPSKQTHMPAAATR